MASFDDIGVLRLPTYLPSPLSALRDAVLHPDATPLLARFPHVCLANLAISQPSSHPRDQDQAPRCQRAAWWLKSVVTGCGSHAGRWATYRPAQARSGYCSTAMGRLLGLLPVCCCGRATGFCGARTCQEHATGRLWCKCLLSLFSFSDASFLHTSAYGRVAS